MGAPVQAPNLSVPSGGAGLSVSPDLSLPASVVTGSPARYGIKPFGGGVRDGAHQAPAAVTHLRVGGVVEAPALSMPSQGPVSGNPIEDASASEALRSAAREASAQGVAQAGRFSGMSRNIRSRIESLRKQFSSPRDADLGASDASFGSLGAADSREAGAFAASPARDSVPMETSLRTRAAIPGARLLQVSALAPSGMALRFDSKKGEGTPDALSLQAEEAGKTDLVEPGSGVELPPSVVVAEAGVGGSADSAPAAPQDGNKNGEKRSGLGKVAMSVMACLVVALVGVEALGSSMPTLVQKTFGDFTMVAQLAIFSSIAGIIGRQIGPIIVEKFGLKKTYIGSYALRLVSISMLAGLLATGHMTLPLMMAFYSLNGLLQGLSVTAMNSIPPALVGQNPAKLERFWSVEQTLLEIIGILGPILTGTVVASFGFLPALIAFPVTAAASIAIVAMTLKLPAAEGPPSPERGSSPLAQGADVKPVVPRSIFKDFFAKVGRGAKLIWNNPVLRTTFLAYSLFMMINPFLYSMIGPAYALRLVGPENAELATSVAGWLTGLYSAGGLLGGLMMTRESHRIEKARESGAIDEAQEKEVLRRSLLRWMTLGTAGLAFLASLAFPLPTLAGLFALPSFLAWAGNITVPALALIPFGIAQVVATLKLQSFFQSRVPRKEDMPDAMGFLGSASLALTTLGLLGLK
ncbi:MAG: MFS transporter, partial [Elusimicrobiota bacterium]